MWRHPRFAVLIAIAAAISAAACTGPTQRAMPPVSQLRIPNGMVYLAMGNKASKADLYSVTVADSKIQRLYHFTAGGADWLSTGNGFVVLSAPAPITDGLVTYSHSKLTPIESAGFSPNLSPSGQLVYTSLLPHPAATVALKVADHPGAPPRKIAVFPVEDNVAAWILNGKRIAVLANRESPATTVSVLNPATGKETRSFQMPGAIDMFSSERNLVACDDNNPAHGGTILNVETGATSRVPNGWLPLAWSPDGTHLLVDDTSRRHLGVINDAVHPSQVQKLSGTSPQPTWTAAWGSR